MVDDARAMALMLARMTFGDFKAGDRIEKKEAVTFIRTEKCRRGFRV